MRAIGYLQPHDIEHQEALLDIELPKPTASERDLLVKISAVSVNPVDTKVRASVAPEDENHKIIGWDGVGEVVAVGEECQLFRVGDKVWYAGDITRPGTNAEYHLVDERIVGHKPGSLSNAEAAALPLTAITAWELLFDRLGFQQNPGSTRSAFQSAAKAVKERILIVGAAGGVGSILTQLANKLTSATVIGTASRPKSKAWVKQLGADYVIDHSKPLTDELARIGIDDVTHVISLTHTEQHFDQLIEVLAPQGKFALIDDPQSGIDIMKLKTKSLSLHWEFMFTRSMFNTHDLEKQHWLLNELATLIDNGTLTTTVGEHYGTINAENLKRAHETIEHGNSTGKIVLEGF